MSDHLAKEAERPWMDLVDQFGMPELEAKALFDRLEPLKTMDERYAILREYIVQARAMRKTVRPHEL